MNLEQFRATKKVSANLHDDLPPSYVEYVEPNTPGLIYEGNLVIEGPNAEGHYYLGIGNFEMTTETSSLEDMEVVLFDFGKDEGIFE